MSPEQRQALLEGPAALPPPGKVSNLVDPPNMLVLGRSVNLVLWGLASLCFAMRMYTKIFLLRCMRMSDYAMIVGWAIFMGYFAPSWLLGGVAPGLDQWNIRLKDFISMLYYFRIGFILYSICMFFIKLSILLQLIEIFGHLRDHFFWGCHCLIWLNFIFYVIATFIGIFPCRPVSKAWDVLITEGSCLDTNLVIVVASAINCVSDLLILIFPQIRIWRLQMSLRKMIAISAVFSVGVMACAAAVVRLVYSVKLFRTANNVSYYSYLVGIWTLPESAGGIIAGCLPSSTRLFQSLARSSLVVRWRGSLQNASRRGRKGSGSDTVIPQQLQPARFRVPSDEYPLTSLASLPGTTIDVPQGNGAVA